MVFLNGPPSVGKTTTARALRRRLEEPFFYIDLDDFLAGYLQRWWDERMDDLWDKSVNAWLLTIRDLGRSGHDVIAATMIKPLHARAYFDLFSEFVVYFVGIKCPVDVAQERENRRHDRKRPMVLNDTPVFRDAHDHPRYDLEIDTSLVRPEQAAERIAELIATTPNPGAFASLLGERVPDSPARTRSDR